MSFALDLSKFIEKAQGNAEEVVRKVGIDMLAKVVDRSPVGNPDLWAVNATASQYNNAVSEWNAALRDDPANLNASGRLRRGLKVNDGMDIKAPEGYVGGRFRGNWQVAFDLRPEDEISRVDANGAATKAAGKALFNSYSSGVKSIWLVNNVPYAYRLETGYSTQAPLGMAGVTAAEFQTFVDQAVRELDT